MTAELPETGERFEGILPPAAPGPAFALRKRAVSIIGLDRYVADGILTTGQAEFLRHAVRERHNILIAGGTSTGKTTLANALLAEIAATGDRVLVLEDTIELQCAARDHVPLRTRAGVVSMTELVRATMRLRPDRVIVGEVRGGEALDLVKVWGTGHPGGIATIHAGSALGALLRGATDPRSGGESAPRPDRRGGQCRDPHRRPRPQAPRRNHFPRRRFRRRGLPRRMRWKRRFPSCRRFLLQPLPLRLPRSLNNRRTAMTHVDAFRLSVNPLSPLPMLARLHRARPAGQGLLLAVLMLLLAGTAQAAGSSMPWEGPLQSILESIRGR